MKVRVGITGSGTMEDPYRPKLSQPVTFHNAKYENDTVIIEISKEDYEKIKDDVIEVIGE